MPDPTNADAPQYSAKIRRGAVCLESAPICGDSKNGAVSGASRAASGISGPAMSIQANERSRENGVLMGGVFGLGRSATFSANSGTHLCSLKTIGAMEIVRQNARILGGVPRQCKQFSSAFSIPLNSITLWRMFIHATPKPAIFGHFWD